VRAAGGRLAVAVTIAIRYSCVRQQGFAENKASSFRAEERQIIDWQVQRYRLFKQLALTYALKFTGKWMIDMFKSLETETTGSYLLLHSPFTPWLLAWRGQSSPTHFDQAW
jgi:hypothetical protein